MFNYNVINPVNIHYRKYPQQNDDAVKADAEEKNKFQTDENGKGGRQFPNGNKVAIDYTKNQVNIAQVLQDFRSTIAAINSPDDVKEEVELYLGMVTKETAKDEPSREIVLNNLKSAARVTDKYIQESLKKPSKVVQDWVEALFLQKVDLKPDETAINEEFKVKIPPKKTEAKMESSAVQYAPQAYQQISPQSNYLQATNVHTGGITPLAEDTVQFNREETAVETPAPAPTPAAIEYTEPQAVEYTPLYTEQQYIDTQAEPLQEETIQESEYQYKTESAYLESSYETSIKEYSDEPAPILEEITELPVEEVIEAPKAANKTAIKKGNYEPKTENERLAKEALLKGKQNFINQGDLYNTLKFYDEALEFTEGSNNTDLKSAIYFERANVFDSRGYDELALIDYHKATRCSDGNLRCHAHIKMGNIYDDYVQIEPAMNQYSLAIESAEEANNSKGKNKALRCMASMFAGIYDGENTESFSELAIEAAKEADSPKTLATTYLEAANNYKYIGNDTKALQMYSACAQEGSLRDDYETQADNFMQASMLMDKKGNKKKAYALLMKAKEYQKLAAMRKSRLAQ